MYQRLANEGSMIADKQCINVNPLIIERKNSYIKAMRIILDKGSEEDYLNEMKHYLDVSNKYINEQAKWLKEQNSYMNRLDYQLFSPKEIKKLTLFQYRSREADMKGTKAMVAMMKTTDVNRQKEYAKIVVDQAKIATEADKELEQIWKKGMPNDLRVRFIKIPPSKCPEENLNIPNVPDLLLPQKQVNYRPVS
jgi:hypothetical protein